MTIRIGNDHLRGMGAGALPETFPCRLKRGLFCQVLGRFHGRSSLVYTAHLPLKITIDTKGNYSIPEMGCLFLIKTPSFRGTGRFISLKCLAMEECFA